MLGDDPDPLVMTARFKFGEVSDAHARGLCTVQRDYAARQEGLEKTRLVSERTTETRGDAATTNGYEVL